MGEEKRHRHALNKVGKSEDWLNARVIMDRYDYISPTLVCPIVSQAFPFLIEGDPACNPWPHLRRDVPHKWYVDRRHPHIGFCSRDEAAILYETAVKFRGKKACEIGCWMGWSTAHLGIGLGAEGELHVFDPALNDPDVMASLKNVCATLYLGMVLYPRTSPAAVQAVGKKWALFFVDGNHDGAAPMIDAEVCAACAEETAAILFHDVVAPDVRRAVEKLAADGWQVKYYRTMQGMAVAYRGDFTPVEHEPDPNVPEINA